jgi:hypothetical protein
MGHERPILCVRCNSICLGGCPHKLGNSRQNVLNPQAHSIFVAARKVIRLNASGAALCSRRRSSCRADDIQRMVDTSLAGR